MMLQLIDRKKIYFYISLLVILLSVHNLTFINELNNFFKIKSILLNENIEDNLNYEINSKLYKFYNSNIFSINSAEIKNELDNFNFMSTFSVIKKYPSTIKINFKKTNLIAYYINDNKKIFIGENGKKIHDVKILHNNLPIIEGEININNFFNLKNILIANGFKLNDFVKFYQNKSKRWDLVYKNNILIKLPINDLKFSIILLKDLVNSENIENVKIIDLRINNKIVLS